MHYYRTADVERDIKTTQKEIDEVAAELETITRTREELEKAGQNDLRTFNDHIGVLALVWRTAYSDAQDIKDWLQKGADKAVSRRPRWSLDFEVC